MKYVMSDIHGCYDKYEKMIRKINLKEEDKLYILGDVVDRGPEPVKILEDMMERPNVVPMIGNHDMFALMVMESLDLDDESAKPSIRTMNRLFDWFSGGGKTTLDAFKKLDHEKRSRLFSYLRKMSVYELCDTGDRTFFLCHAGLGNYRKDKRIDDYKTYEFVETRPDPEIRYFEGDSVFLVCGHTPTACFTGGDNRIYHKNGNIFIDCGAVQGGKLGCLCLDTFEEYYV